MQRGLWRRRLRPQFDTTMPLELTNVVDPRYFYDFACSINNYSTPFDMLGNLCLVLILTAFIMFPVGGVMEQQRGPGLLIAGFVMFAMGGFLRVYTAKLAMTDYQQHCLSKCSEASQHFPSTRFSYQVQQVGFTYDNGTDNIEVGNNGIHFHHSGGHYRGIFECQIIIEYPINR